MPPQLVELTLARALKLKNRVVSRLARFDALIVANNSNIDDSRDYDIHDLYRARTELVDLLIALKAAINAANQPIQAAIYRLAEYKSLIATLNKIDARHGPHLEGYSSVRVNYVAQWRKVEIAREVKRIEAEIDRIQDELDRHNAGTTIMIDAATLADEAPGLGVPADL